MRLPHDGGAGPPLGWGVTGLFDFAETGLRVLQFGKGYHTTDGISLVVSTCPVAGCPGYP
eukprot:12912497-Prorocentrum_lima.AAC.1